MGRLIICQMAFHVLCFFGQSVEHLGMQGQILGSTACSCHALQTGIAKFNLPSTNLLIDFIKKLLLFSAYQANYPEHLQPANYMECTLDYLAVMNHSMVY